MNVPVRFRAAGGETMSSPIPPLPSVGDFIAAFERFVVVPPKRRGPSARIVLMPQGDPEVAARIATGALAFANGGKVPVNKRLLILHDTRDGPEVSLECGYRDSGTEQRTWGPGGGFDCPRDEQDPD